MISRIMLTALAAVSAASATAQQPAPAAAQAASVTPAQAPARAAVPPTAPTATPPAALITTPPAAVATMRSASSTAMPSAPAVAPATTAGNDAAPAAATAAATAATAAAADTAATPTTAATASDTTTAPNPARAPLGVAAAPYANTASGGGLMQTTFALAFVIALLLGGAWVLKRFGPRGFGGGNNTVKLVGALSVGARERIIVVEVGQQWIVVGASPGRMNALATMARQEAPEFAAGSQPMAAPANFADWIKHTISERNRKQ